MCDLMSQIHHRFDCDVFFPDLDKREDFREVTQDSRDPRVPEGIHEEDGIKYNYCLYERVVRE